MNKPLNGSTEPTNDLIKRIDDLARSQMQAQSQMFSILREVAVNQQKLSLTQQPRASSVVTPPASPPPRSSQEVKAPPARPQAQPTQPKRPQAPQAQPQSWRPQEPQPQPKSRPHTQQPPRQSQPSRPQPQQLRPQTQQSQPAAAQRQPVAPVQPPRPQNQAPQKQPQQQQQQQSPQPKFPAAQRQQAAPRQQAAQSKPATPNRLQQWWEKEDLVTRLLAIIGGSITVVGLTFLALLAYASGFLSPTGAVILAAVLCGGLAVTATVVNKRQPNGVSAAALLIVATLGGLADLWVAVFKMGWFSEAVGSVLTVVICAGSLGLAYAWKKEILASIVTAFAPLFIVPVAASFLSMFPSDNPVQREIHTGYFAGSLLAAAICGFAARWGRPWFKLQVTATVTYIIAMLMASPFAVSTFLMGVVGFAILAILSFVPPWASRQLHVGSVLAVVVVPAALLCVHDSWVSPAFIALATACSFFIARANGGMYKVDFQVDGNAPLPPRVASAFTFAISAGTLPIIFIIRFFRWHALDGEVQKHLDSFPYFGYWSIGIAVALLVFTAAIVWGLPKMPRSVAWISLICSFLAVFTYAPFSWVNSKAMEIPGSAIVLVMSLLLSVALAYRHQHLFDTEIKGIAGREVPASQANTEVAKLLIGIVTLVLASSAIPAVAMAISATKLSFMVAHVLISVSWMLGAVYLLHRNNSKPGLLLAITATAKLVFYDLSVLGGLVQALAFLICGMVLLVAAVTREKPNKNTTVGPPNPQQQSVQPQPPQNQSIDRK